MTFIVPQSSIMIDSLHNCGINLVDTPLGNMSVHVHVCVCVVTLTLTKGHVALMLLHVHTIVMVSVRIGQKYLEKGSRKIRNTYNMPLSHSL